MTDEELASIWVAARDEAEHAEPGTNVTPLRAFARRIAEIEREECAKVCEEMLVGSHADIDDLAEELIHSDCAAAIRARGEK